MAKIIKIDNDIVTIVRDDESMIEVSRSSLSFTPSINLKVEVYEKDGEYIVNRAETKTYTKEVKHTQTIYTGQKMVDKIAYGLLAIFTGGFGIHKFYAGKVGTGIIYLIFFWTGIPAIIGFIEGIIALTKPEIQPGKILI